jgi:hypothetical protein
MKLKTINYDGFIGPKSKILSYQEYINYFDVNRMDCGNGIEPDNEFRDYYLFIQTYLPKSYFNIARPSMLDSFSFMGFNEKQIPDEVLVKFELIGKGEVENTKSFIFKPWIINIENQANSNHLEKFHLYMPDYIFYSIIDKAIFMEQFNWNQLSQLRVLKDVDKNEFKKFGLTTETVETMNFTTRSNESIIETDKSLQKKIKSIKPKFSIEEKYYDVFARYF